MNERADRRILEILLGGGRVEGILEGGDLPLLIDIIGSDPGFDLWLEKTLAAQPAGMDPEVSRRMLERIHDAIAKQKA